MSGHAPVEGVEQQYRTEPDESGSFEFECLQLILCIGMERPFGKIATHLVFRSLSHPAK